MDSTNESHTLSCSSLAPPHPPVQSQAVPAADSTSTARCCCLPLNLNRRCHHLSLDRCSSVVTPTCTHFGPSSTKVGVPVSVNSSSSSSVANISSISIKSGRKEEGKVDSELVCAGIKLIDDTGGDEERRTKVNRTTNQVVEGKSQSSNNCTKKPNCTRRIKAKVVDSHSKISQSYKSESNQQRTKFIQTNLQHKLLEAKRWQKACALFSITTLFALIQASNQLRLMAPQAKWTSNMDAQHAHRTANVARQSSFSPTFLSTQPTQLAAWTTLDNSKNNNNNKQRMNRVAHDELVSLKQMRNSEDNRQRTTTAAAAAGVLTSTSEPKLVLAPPEGASFYAQLAKLRRQLFERGGRQVALGAPCLSASDCSVSIGNSHCRLDNFTCACLPHHVEYNSTTCLAPSLLGFPCLIDSQCQRKVAHSYCAPNGICACPLDEFVPYRRDKCLPASKLDEYCLTNQQCSMYDAHSYCKWKIPNVYGLCKCPPNYKLVSELEFQHRTNGTRRSSSSSRVERVRRNATTTTTTNTDANNNNNNTRCAPRLGDSCFSTVECQLATQDSICGPATNEVEGKEEEEDEDEGLVVVVRSQAAHVMRRQTAEQDNKKKKKDKQAASRRFKTTGWHTSNASRRKCECARGFTQALNRLSCLPANPTQPPSPTTTTTTTTTSAPPTSEQSQVESKTTTTTAATSTSTEQAAPIIHLAEAGQNSEHEKAKNRYELVIGTGVSDEPAHQLESGSTAAPAVVSTPSAVLPVGEKQSSSKKTQRNTMSSLGKACSSDLECKRRDPHSYCDTRVGVCECIKPTETCSSNSTGCHSNTFQCRSSGQCISWYFVCDSFKNCDDGSDEDDCQLSPAVGVRQQQQHQCPAESFMCSNGKQCVSYGKLCNGKADCLDASDELQCGAGGGVKQQEKDKGACHPRAFSCDNGQCLPAYVFCNAVPDCTDGSDESEQLCERTSKLLALNSTQQALNNNDDHHHHSTTPTTSAPNLTLQPQQAAAAAAVEQVNWLTAGNRTTTTTSSSFLQDSPLLKADRASINKMLAALKRQQQQQQQQQQKRANSRQQQRLRRNSRLGADFARAFECPKSSFTCANGKCRSSAILCSGVDGCGDNSDEQHCEVCKCSPA